MKKTSKGFSAEERAAMQERAKELAGNDGEAALLEKINQMTGLDKELGQKLHKIIKTNAPSLMPKTWYGMPAYANKDGKTVIFFRCAQKFKERYAQLGFNDMAHLDEGNMWPVVYAVTKLSPADEAKIAELVKKAIS